MDENKKSIGQFIVNGEKRYGELLINKEDTLLTIWSEVNECLPPFQNEPDEIKGLMFESFKYVTLLGLLDLGNGFSSKTNVSGTNERLETYRLFSHHIVTGPTNFNAKDEIFDSLQFELSELSKIFRTPGLYHKIIFPDKDLVKDLLESDHKRIHTEYGFENKNVDIRIGDNCSIHVNTGIENIIQFQTVLGQICLDNRSSGSYTSSVGFEEKNRVVCSIKFMEKLRFSDAYEKIWPIINLFELIAGRKLEISNVSLLIEDDEIAEKRYDVYTSMYNPRIKESSFTHPLISPNDAKEEFSKLATNWLKKTESWKSARGHFFRNFASNHYSSDRLVSAANMFDLIPSTEFPKNIELPDDLLSAKEICDKQFRNLPHTEERASVLQALKRIGSMTLKNKVKVRAKSFKEYNIVNHDRLEKVINEAINCRNYYVHGNGQKLDYEKHWEVVQFFTDTLEFVFGLSELIEAGLDIVNILKNRSLTFHPHLIFIRHFDFAYEDFKKALDEFKER